MPVSRPAIFLAIVLLIAGFVRIGALVLHDPVLGYANQFDEGRTSACIGLWPDLPEPARYEAHREAPVARYVEGARRLPECYASTEVVFAGASMLAWRTAVAAGLADPRAMDTRFLGGVKALVLIALAIAFTIALREHPFWLVAHAAIFALVLADPFVTLWMNTLYTEFSAVLCGYACVILVLLLCCVRPDRRKIYGFLALAMIGLGMSRQQHAFLPLCLALLMIPVGWRYRPGWTATIVLLAVAIAVLQSFVPRPATVRAANNVDVVLGTLLPLASDQGRALVVLRLPERCAGSIGATWYVAMGEVLAERCPEAATLPRGNVIDLLLHEPSVAVRAMAKAAPLLRTTVLRYLGIEAGARFATIEGERPLPVRSLVIWLEQLPLWVHLGWQLFLVALLPVAALVWLVFSARGGGSAGPLVGAALAGIFSYAFATSVLGDGLVEVARHAHLGMVAALSLLIVIALTLFAGAFARRSPNYVVGAPIGEATSLEFKLGVTAIAICVAMTGMLWVPAFRKLPLAIGTIDEPQANRTATTRTTLRGWVLDPLGTVQAYAIVGDKTRVEARPYRHPTDPVGAELARVFPYYRDPAAARFEIPLDLSALGAAPIRVRTYAVNANDVVTELDRRVLEPRAR